MKHPRSIFADHRFAARIAGVVAILAAGAFLVVGVGAMNDDPPIRPMVLVDDRDVTITSPEDVAAKRRALVDLIWGSEGFPSTQQPSVETGLRSPLSPMQHLRTVNRLRFAMENNERNLAYEFIPRNQNHEAVLVHQGHRCSLDDRARPGVRDGIHGTIDALLTRGYTVLAMFMPHYTPEDCRTGTLHDGMFARSVTTGSALKFFVEPTAVTLNYLKARGYENFSMTGLSGGGWTTTLYAAIDPAIRQSISVAGSIPLYLRPQDSRAGDAEQVLPQLYKIAGYLDLYLMGAAGKNRRQIQILNRRDDCCFGERQHTGVDGTWRAALRKYESQVRLALDRTGPGSFRLEIDDAADHHTISRHSVRNVLLPALGDSFSPPAAEADAPDYVGGANG